MERQREPKEMRTDRRDAAYNDLQKNIPQPENSKLPSPREQAERAEFLLEKVKHNQTAGNSRAIGGFDLSGNPEDTVLLEDPNQIPMPAMPNIPQRIIVAARLKKAINKLQEEKKLLENDPDSAREKELNDRIAWTIYELCGPEIGNIAMLKKDSSNINSTLEEIKFLEQGLKYLQAKQSLDETTKEKINTYRGSLNGLRKSLSN